MMSSTLTARSGRLVTTRTSSTTVRCSISATPSAAGCRCGVPTKPPSIRNTAYATGSTTSTVRTLTRGTISMTSLTRSHPKEKTNRIPIQCRRSSENNQELDHIHCCPYHWPPLKLASLASLQFPSWKTID